MATYNRTKKVYYTIAYGKLKRYEGEGKSSEFTGIDGIFTGITLREREINGEKKVFTDFNFVDGNENFCISCEKFGSNGTTIIRCLVNVKDFSKKILVETWQTEKKGKTYTNVSLSQDGKRVSWVDIPEVETFQIATGETVKSTKKRDGYIESLIDSINAAVHGEGGPAASVREPDPDPAEDAPQQQAPEAEPGYGPEPPFPNYVPNAGL